MDERMNKLIALYNKQLEENPEDINKRNVLAYAYYNAGLYDDARKVLLETIAKYKNYNAYRLMIKLEKDYGDKETAEIYALEALDAFPESESLKELLESINRLKIQEENNKKEARIKKRKEKKKNKEKAKKNFILQDEEIDEEPNQEGKAEQIEENKEEAIQELEQEEIEPVEGIEEKSIEEIEEPIGQEEIIKIIEEIEKHDEEKAEIVEEPKQEEIVESIEENKEEAIEETKQEQEAIEQIEKIPVKQEEVIEPIEDIETVKKYIVDTLNNKIKSINNKVKVIDPLYKQLHIEKKTDVDVKKIKKDIKNIIDLINGSNINSEDLIKIKKKLKLDDISIEFYINNLNDVLRQTFYENMGYKFQDMIKRAENDRIQKEIDETQQRIDTSKLTDKIFGKRKVYVLKKEKLELEKQIVNLKQPIQYRTKDDVFKLFKLYKQTHGLTPEMSKFIELYNDKYANKYEKRLIEDIINQKQDEIVPEEITIFNAGEYELDYMEIIEKYKVDKRVDQNFLDFYKYDRAESNPLYEELDRYFSNTLLNKIKSYDNKETEEMTK